MRYHRLHLSRASMGRLPSVCLAVTAGYFAVQTTDGSLRTEMLELSLHHYTFPLRIWVAKEWSWRLRQTAFSSFLNLKERKRANWPVMKTQLRMGWWSYLESGFARPSCHADLQARLIRWNAHLSECIAIKNKHWTGVGGVKLSGGNVVPMSCEYLIAWPTPMGNSVGRLSGLGRWGFSLCPGAALSQQEAGQDSEEEQEEIVAFLAFIQALTQLGQRANQIKDIHSILHPYSQLFYRVINEIVWPF